MVANLFDGLVLKSKKIFKLGDPEGKVVNGKIFHIVEDDLYIDFGWKFHCVCPRPKKRSEYVKDCRILENLTRCTGVNHQQIYNFLKAQSSLITKWSKKFLSHVAFVGGVKCVFFTLNKARVGLGKEFKTYTPFQNLKPSLISKVFLRKLMLQGYMLYKHY